MFYCIFLLFLLVVSCEKKPEAETVRPVKAIQVQETQIEGNQFTFPGTLRALKRANLSFRVDGFVVKRDIFVGQNVKQDQTLIQLDTKDYDIAFKKAKGKVESTQAQLNFATRDYERMKNIYDTDPGAISASYLDRKLENTNQIKGELAVAQGELDRALVDLSYTSLKAPFDGIITAIYVENHEQVRAKQTALRLIDISETEMEINIPEKYINMMLEGKTTLKFKVILDAIPSSAFTAFIKEIGTEASGTTLTYPVTLALKDVPIDLLLLGGMTGKAILQETQPSSAASLSNFKLPKSSILIDNQGQTFVWIVDPSSQTIHKKSVKVDEKGKNEFAYITSGLTPGDWVVTAGTSFLSEGQKVKLVPEHSSP